MKKHGIPTRSLQEFKQIILEKLQKAKADYDLLRSTITHTASNDIEDTSPTFKVLEEGAATLSKEESGRLAQRQLKFIQHLEAALVRIENKTYGICRETGEVDPEGTPAYRTARHAVYRSQRRAQIAITRVGRRLPQAVPGSNLLTKKRARPFLTHMPRQITIYTDGAAQGIPDAADTG